MNKFLKKKQGERKITYKNILFLGIIFTIFSLLTSFSSALPSDSDVNLTFNYPINYSEVPTVNNSEYFDGYSVATLWTYYTGLGNALWCQLTGCTMAGDIDMDGNTIYDGVYNGTFNGDWNGSSDYVPYTGATSNVNISSYNLTTTGTIYAGEKEANPTGTIDLDLYGYILTTSNTGVDPSFRGKFRMTSGADIGNEYTITGITVESGWDEIAYTPADTLSGDFEILVDSVTTINENIITKNITVENIIADFLYGDGSQLTNLPGDYWSRSGGVLTPKDDTDEMTLYGYSRFFEGFGSWEESTFHDDSVYEDNKKIYLGTGKDSSIYHDTTNMIINPKEVGSGLLKILGDLFVNENLTVAGDTYLNDTEVTGNLNQTNGNATINNIYGGMFYHNHTGTSLNFAVDGTYYTLFFTNATHLNGFTYAGGWNQTSNLTAEYDGVYQASYMAIGDGQNNHAYYTSIFINGVNQQQCENEHKLSAGGDVLTQNGFCFIEVDVGDVIDVRTANVGNTGTGNYYGGNLNLVRIGN